MAHPFIYEINTWAWLESISVEEGKRIDFGFEAMIWGEHKARFEFLPARLFHARAVGCMVGIDGDGLVETIRFFAHESKVIDPRGAVGLDVSDRCFKDCALR